MEQERLWQNDIYYVISITKLDKCPVLHYDLEVWSLVAALSPETTSYIRLKLYEYNGLSTKFPLASEI